MLPVQKYILVMSAFMVCGCQTGLLQHSRNSHSELMVERERESPFRRLAQARWENGLRWLRITEGLSVIRIGDRIGILTDHLGSPDSMWAASSNRVVFRYCVMQEIRPLGTMGQDVQIITTQDGAILSINRTPPIMQSEEEPLSYGKPPVGYLWSEIVRWNQIVKRCDSVKVGDRREHVIETFGMPQFPQFSPSNMLQYAVDSAVKPLGQEGVNLIVELDGRGVVTNIFRKDVLYGSFPDD